MDTIYKVLEILAILATAIIAIWQVGRTYGKFESKVKEYDSKLDKLPCEKTKGKVGENDKRIAVLEAHQDNLKTSIDEIKSDVRKIRDSLIQGGAKASSLAQQQSPVSLTTKGLRFFEDLKIQLMIDAHWDSLKKIIDKNIEGVDNPYDIQQACFDVCDNLESFLNEEELKTIKQHAYETGTPLFHYTLLFGVPIRDRILNEKGYTHKDVDDNAPSHSEVTQQ